MPGPIDLVLEARFIAGSYGGVEWPPSPFRLLQAMVSGLRSVEHPGLRWLEAQHPPWIQAQQEPLPARFSRSVPNNANPAQATTTLRPVLCRRVSQPVRYGFTLPDEVPPGLVEAVLEAAHAVHTLGTGEDMCAVRGHVCERQLTSHEHGLIWHPTGPHGPIRAPGLARLNVPVAGSLASLEARHQAFQARLDQQRNGFGRPIPAPALHGVELYRTSLHRPRWALLPFRLQQPGATSEPARFHPEHAVIVGGLLRHAAMRLAGPGPMADFAAGYGTDDDPDHRLSWVPLPSVGHRHVDGMVRRGLWMARACDIEALEMLVQSMPEQGLPLVDEHSGECVAIAKILEPEEDAVLSRYLEPSDTWATVTPMIMPGDFAGNQRLLNRLLLKALRESGLDPGLLIHAEFSKQGFMRNAVNIRDLKLKDWKAKNLILQHVRLRFAEPLRGPLVLGRGRHYGVGLFCADPE